MLICHCRAVNERTIDASILAGASCAEDIVSMCGAGSRCGGCLPALRELLERRGVPVEVVRSAGRSTAA